MGRLVSLERSAEVLQVRNVPDRLLGKVFLAVFSWEEKRWRE